MSKPVMTEEFNNIDKEKLSKAKLASEILQKMSVDKINEYKNEEFDFGVGVFVTRVFFTIEETDTGYKVSGYQRLPVHMIVILVLSFLTTFFGAVLFALAITFTQKRIKNLLNDARVNISEVYSTKNSNVASLSKMDELKKLNDLKNDGVLSEEEFDQEKKKLLAS